MLDAMLFNVGTGAWNVAANWFDLTDPSQVRVPTANDDVGIPGGATVTLSGTNAEVNSIATAAGSALTISSGIELKIDGNQPAGMPAGFPTSTGSDSFAGTTTITGRINANTANMSDPPNVILAGPTGVGPGDTTGNLVAGPQASITFTGGGGTDAFAAGATIGMGSGDIVIATPVALGGVLKLGTGNMTLVTGGTLDGAGALDDWANFTWTGGTLAPAGGVQVEPSYYFTVSGSATKSLGTVLTNDSLTTDLGGTGVLILLGPAGGAPGGAINNVNGTLDVSLPTIGNASGGTGGITNDGTLDGQAPASSPTTIGVPFVNDGSGILSVDNGAALTLMSPPGTTDTLNGTLELNGTLTLGGSFVSTAGFNLTTGNGSLLLGDGGTYAATLTLDGDTTTTLNGTLEVTSTGTLTGAGQLTNSGTLQLDLSSSTAGLGAYQQSSTGTLVIEAIGPGSSSTLTVTGLAQLSGTLKLKPVGGYTPSSGDAFTIVSAGSISAHFDSLPPNTTATYGATGVTLTEN